MWKLFKRTKELGRTMEISAADLSVLMEPLHSKLIVLDLRVRDEVEQYPYMISVALHRRFCRL